MTDDESTGQPLRQGYTTGACAAAAAKGAALAIMSGVPIYRVEILLPAGIPLVLPIDTLAQGETSASCSVIKDAGDDPDVTHKAEIVAHIQEVEEDVDEKEIKLAIVSGQGVGKVTKPGLPVAVGQAAINPVPMSMIQNEVREVLRHFGKKTRGKGFQVTIEVPKGEELALKTLNPRLGILGGISILGTTGIVEPISTSAWKETVAAQIDVALACGNKKVVLTPGRSSEKAAEELLPDLPEEAFVQMGDFVGASLGLCVEKGVEEVVVVAMPGKMSKIAMGYEDTHYKASKMRFDELGSWARDLGVDADLVERISGANTAREIWEFLPADAPLYDEICRRAKESCETFGGGKLKIETLLVGYDGGKIDDR
jgi:cobalt-precorrin-5B (C1)-methyltransferase